MALDMYLEEGSKLGSTIEITKIVLNKFYTNDTVRWHWRIIGDRKDRQLTTSEMMWVDSETGEVIFKNMH